MPLPTCECVAGLPPWDRLSAIYCATREMVDPTPPTELGVYTFLDLRAAAGVAITPAVLNTFQKGEIPGDWQQDACRHGGVVAAANPTHTFSRALVFTLSPFIVCDGETFTDVTREIQNDKNAAPDPTDYDYIKWVPGEVIAENFLVGFRYQTNRSLGADTGGLSIDVLNLSFGGNGAVFQVQMDSGGNLSARAHGGQRVPMVNGVRYAGEMIADITGGRADFWLKNDVTGDFIGAGGEEYTDGVTLNAMHTGDYLTNGNGTQGLSAIYTNKGAAAEFQQFLLPSVTNLIFTQTDINTGAVTWNSGGLNWRVERSTNGGADWQTLVEDHFSGRSSIVDTVTYQDSEVNDGQTVIYRVTAKVRNVISASAISAPVTINNGPFAPPTWTDSLDGTLTNTNDDFPESPALQPIVCGTTGSCVKLRVWIREYNNPLSFKVGLYNSSHVLIGQGAVVNLASSAGAWAEVTLNVAVPVTMGTTYGIGFCFSDNIDGKPGFLSGQPANTAFLNFSSNYAAFPNNPFVVAGNGVTWKFAAGMGVI